MLALSDYYESLGYSPSEWHVGPEHPRLEEFTIDLLRKLPRTRVLEVGYQAGGFAVPVILALRDRPDFTYTGIDSGAYRNAVSGEVIGDYLRTVGVRSTFAFNTGDAGEFVAHLLPDSFDLVLIDHFKPLYPRELYTVIRRGIVSEDGVVLLHDVLGNAAREWEECKQICAAFGYRWSVIDEVPQGLAVMTRGSSVPRFERGIARGRVEARQAYRRLRQRLGHFRRQVRGAR